MKKSIRKRLKNIKSVFLDVDGVLTNGSITYLSNGLELKSFNAKDGSMIKMAKRVGIEIVLITGRESNIVKMRAEELDIFCYQGVIKKIKKIDEHLNTRQIKWSEAMYIGDDIIDIPVMEKVGIAIAVADAVPDVKEIAHHITELKGGQGAVGEILTMLIKEKDLWKEGIKRYI